VHRWGRGPRVVLVHGSVLGGRHAWTGQRPLTERWTLLAPDRPGHGDKPADGRTDFAHLVGLSYGGLVAPFAAARRPAAVRSLTLVEPPAWRHGGDDPAVRAYDEEGQAAIRSSSDPCEVLRAFLAHLHIDIPVANPLPEPLERGTRALMDSRPAGEAELPLAEIADAGIPVLAITGGHEHAFEAVADAIAAELGAQRTVIPGAGHLVPDAGEPFNVRLEDFLRVAEHAP
jgi:pimeloyl-ACP methyl ester carboxylesterase